MFIIVMAIIMVIWDLFAQFTGGNSATISNAFIVFSHQHPWILFVAGLIAGHLLWRMEPTPEMIEEHKKWGKVTEDNMDKSK